MKAIVIYLIFTFLVLEVSAQSERFDSTKHFVKEIFFIFNRDTISGLRDTLRCKIWYESIERTVWTENLNMWRSYNLFVPRFDPSFNHDLSLLESLYVRKGIKINDAFVGSNCIETGQIRLDNYLEKPLGNVRVGENAHRLLANGRCIVVLMLKVSMPDNTVQELNISFPRHYRWN